MGVSPPNLHDDTGQGVSVRSDFTADAAVSLLTVHGPWDDQLRRETSVSLRRCFAEHPDALIVDLSRLLDPGSESAPTWTSARSVAAALRPPVQLALCVPPELPLAGRMQGLDAGRFLPVYAKVRQARVAVAGRIPDGERLVTTLRPDPDAPSAARNLVSDACLAWGLARLLHPARLVMSELVTNAVEHAGTDLRVVVTRRGTGLYLSVADGSPVLPRLLSPARPQPGRPLDERGRGLQTVHATAELWGAVPAAGGKVVWATVRERRTVA
ncbi:ATP-binding protein [Actinoplanes regularis]|uniref:Histidine kinase-like ATPase domain-containing protein n=1 Tax=Actinoplanes regularis TaxID=52697 RepID=A0A238VDB6_9ACTN|nr:ATP-binding protein [Actinoplanes regularis]GIE83632.1 hypothetical protein Are01nite_01120 [Actinoplanes regularis]GLW29523.1 hypothetical protein Areg01_24630 [Actinoplanes regularis]SNR31529.1 hypothetical protein SAMN06264365_101961 [Actinoplanes regularis]